VTHPTGSDAPRSTSLGQRTTGGLQSPSTALGGWSHTVTSVHRIRRSSGLHLRDPELVASRVGASPLCPRVERPRDPDESVTGARNQVDEYSAMVGGVIYENVAIPILLDDEPLIQFSRNFAGRLMPSLHLRDAGGETVLVMEEGVLKSRREGLESFQTRTRLVVHESDRSRVWLDVLWKADEIPELILGAITHSRLGIPVILCPDRTLIMGASPTSQPNFRGATITADPGHQGTAMRIANHQFHILDARIQNVRVGLRIDLFSDG
jgi:hypothetical protein